MLALIAGAAAAHAAPAPIAGAAAAHAAAGQRASATPAGVVQRTIAVNQLAMPVTNVGFFALDLSGFRGALEYPRGSGKTVAFDGALWFSGRASGALRTAITEYDTEFVPGPASPGGPGLDTLQHSVFAITRGDTTGTGAWMARAVPIGAPLDSTGLQPGLIGDQTLWTVYTDAGVTSRVYNRGPRTPLGLEVQLTTYAFHRPPLLENVLFLHFELIHRGTEALDSAYVGLWYDADVRSAVIPAACDSSLDLGYVYRLSDDSEYGRAGPATGMMLLRGPHDTVTGLNLRASSIVGYNNGNDPQSAADYDGVLQGRYPWGAVMIDSTTMLPTNFYAWGDPAAGTGWLMTNVVDPKLVVSAGPFHFAPGDTQTVDAAIVVGQGVDQGTSIVAMRSNALEARNAFASGFSSLPGWIPPPVQTAPLLAHPNPFRDQVQFDVLVPAGGASLELDVFDLTGRRVRRLSNLWQPGGVAHLSWDGADDSGRHMRAGIYFARSRVAGRDARARVVLVR
jgi:hypothetical protein